MYLTNRSLSFQKVIVTKVDPSDLNFTLYARTPQNGQIHSNNSSAVANELFECVWPLLGVGVQMLVKTKKYALQNLQKNWSVSIFERHGWRKFLDRLLYRSKWKLDSLKWALSEISTFPADFVLVSLLLTLNIFHTVF